MITRRVCKAKRAHRLTAMQDRDGHGTMRLCHPACLLADGLMNGAAMPHQIVVGDDEFLQRRVDLVEIDVSDKAVDAGIDAVGLSPCTYAPFGIRLAIASRSARPRAMAASDRNGRCPDSDSAGRCILVPSSRPSSVSCGCSRLECVEELAPIALVLPARIGHHPIEVIKHARHHEVLHALRMVSAASIVSRIFG